MHIFSYRNRAAGLDVNFPQCGHVCGSLSWPNRMWKRKLLLFLYFRSQMWHWNFGIFSLNVCTSFVCDFTAASVLNDFPHVWHKNDFGSVSLVELWIFVTCDFNPSWDKNLVGKLKWVNLLDSLELNAIYVHLARINLRSLALFTRNFRFCFFLFLMLVTVSC